VIFFYFVNFAEMAAGASVFGFFYWFFGLELEALSMKLIPEP
jgi:hypothetical protein